MNRKIRHEGVVLSTGTDRIRVQITRHSACIQCRTRQYCTYAEKEEKIIDAYCPGIKPEPGSTVFVTVSETVATTAVLLAYVIPLFILLAVLFITYTLTGKEAWAGIGAIASLIPYYRTLYAFRKRLKKKIVFTIQQ